MSNQSIALSKERWLEAAEHLEKATVPIANILRRINHEGQGKTDAIDFENEMMMAYTAIRYVAEFATDKCRFMAYPERK